MPKVCALPLVQVMHFGYSVGVCLGLDHLYSSRLFLEKAFPRPDLQPLLLSSASTSLSCEMQFCLFTVFFLAQSPTLLMHIPELKR